MSLALLSLCLTLQPQAEPNPSPSAIWLQAATDVQRLPADQAVNTRYLSLATIPPEDRAKLLGVMSRERWKKVLAYHNNALSVASDLVPGTITAGGNLLRIDLRDYGWKRETWEALAEVEPFFHVKLKIGEGVGARVYWQGGLWDEFGREHPRGLYSLDKPCKTVMTAIAPWLTSGPGLESVKTLVGWTQSGVPIVDARWFMWQTAVQADRKPGYYDFLGIKDKADFDALVGFDGKLAAKAKRVELLEAVANSTVTLQPRRIGGFPSIGGTFWQTFDSREAIDEHNPLRVLNGGLKFDAMEVFGALPNGIMFWGLFNADGGRQDTAPDFIASDSTSHGTDRRVHAGLSCIRCHGQHDGIQPVDGWARNLFRGPLTLQSPDYDKLKELRQKYLRDIEAPMAASRAVYAAAVKQACGLEVKELATEYGRAFAEYEQPVSIERAARDVGLKPEELSDKLRGYLRESGSVDTVVAGFLSDRKGGIPIRQYQEAFPLMMLAIEGRK